MGHANTTTVAGHATSALKLSCTDQHTVQVVLGDAVTSYEEQGSSSMHATTTPAASKALDAVTIVPRLSAPSTAAHTQLMEAES